MGTGPFLEKLNLKRHFPSQKSNVLWYPFATREEGQQFTMAVSVTTAGIHLQVISGQYLCIYIYDEIQRC